MTSWTQIFPAMGTPAPDNAFGAGNEADGQPLFIARAVIAGSYCIGKYGAHLGGANFPYGGKETPVTSAVEIYSGAGTWKPAAPGKLPLGAFVAGLEADGTPLFVARAHHGGGIHPGKYSAKYGKCYIPWGGKEFEVTSHFEILCL